MTIDGGTVEYDDSAETGTLNLSSGDLTGPGTLTVSTLTVWTGGTMDGVGNTIAQGTLDIGLASDTNDQETLDGRTLTNAGAANWAGGGSISQADGGTFVNEASASFAIENDPTWSSDGTGTFANAGTLLESAGAGTTILDAALDNTGSVQVQQGTLSLQGGGVEGGSYLVLAGATLTFGNDNVTTTSVALPSDFTAGPLNWAGTFTGSAQDKSGSGLASVGVSLFDGHDYYDGTAFTSPTAVFNAAALSGNSWTYTIPTAIFTGDLAYVAGSEATDNDRGTEPSTISSILLAPAAPTVSAVAPATGPVAGGTKVTITGLYLANATAVDFGTKGATIVSDTNTTIVVISPTAAAAGGVNVTVTTAEGTSAADRFTYFTVTPPTPPRVTSAQLLDVTVITGHGKHQKKTTKFAGFKLIFNEALNSVNAQNSRNYEVLQTTKKGKKTVSTPVSFSVSYDAADDTVNLTLAGKPTFTSGGRLMLTASGITDPSGDTLAGNTVFTILPKAKGISG